MTHGPRRIRDYFAHHRGSFALGIAALIATQAAGLTVPRLLRHGTDALIEHSEREVFRAAIALIVLAAIGAAVRIASRILIFNAGRKVEFEIRNDCFAHLMRLSPPFYQRMPLGQVMSRLVNDLTQVRLLLGPGLLNLSNTFLVYAVVIPLLFVTDAELAFYSLLPLPALALIGRAFARRMYLLSKEQQEKLGTLSEKVQENLSGVMTVRAYRREALEIRDFDARNDVYNRISLKLAQLRGTMFPLLGMMGGISAIVLLALGGDRIARGAMTVGQFVEFNAYLAALTWPTIALGWMISLWQRGMASMDRINEIFSSAPDLTDGPSSEPIASTAIELRGLTYTYASAVDGIRDITATIEPGQRIAVVGKTGAGKTTLLEAIARVVPVSPGQIFLGGRDVVDLPLSAVRSNISYAPQDAFLFSRSIAENVAFGDPDADDARVAEAVASASFAVDLAAFPDGLDTIVGERGITLSGGQRQRTTLARALLAEAPILILDDTLSAVDTETEAKILDELLERGNGKTIIVATHRLAFAARADLILVLEAGRLVERGTEADLLAKGGVYAEMHARQRIREEILASQRAAPAEDAA